MKKLLLLVSFSIALGISAQTNTAPIGTSQSVFDALGASPIAQATNYCVDVYGTYMPKAPTTKYGGGAILFYNLSEFVAAGIGGDYLGKFSLVSANLALRLPIHPFKNNTSMPAFLRELTLTPFTLTGTGKPTGGTSGQNTAVIQDNGVYVGFGHLWGGQFNTGVAYGQWINAGDYSGHRYHVFLGWSKGF